MGELVNQRELMDAIEEQLNRSEGDQAALKLEKARCNEEIKRLSGIIGHFKQWN